jgi:hypothetical protein
LSSDHTIEGASVIVVPGNIHPAQPLRPAVHRTIVVVDVEGFADQRRTNLHQVAVRAGLYRALKRAFRRVKVPWNGCYREDRGDGVFLLAPAEITKSRFITALPDALIAALGEHNRRHGPEEQIRLRMALHAGEINYDQHGVTAVAINLAFRLVNAEPLKLALAESRGILAIITSSWFFDEVIRNSTSGDLSRYVPTRIAVKETTTTGWIHLPGQAAAQHPTGRPVAAR